MFIRDHEDTGVTFMVNDTVLVSQANSYKYFSVPTVTQMLHAIPACKKIGKGGFRDTEDIGHIYVFVCTLSNRKDMTTDQSQR